jgi:hypothetical protein
MTYCFELNAFRAAGSRSAVSGRLIRCSEVREYFGSEFVGKDIELCRSWKKVEFAMSVLMSATV